MKRLCVVAGVVGVVALAGLGLRSIPREVEVIETNLVTEPERPREVFASPAPEPPTEQAPEPVIFFPAEELTDHNESADDEDVLIMKGETLEAAGYAPGTSMGVGSGGGSGGRYGGRYGGRSGPAAQPAEDTYGAFVENGWKDPSSAPLSTFSVDVDRASYSIVRRYLMQQRTLPPPDAVRVEELINSFDYQDAPPTGAHPFSVRVETAGCPWNADARLVRIGLKGRVIARAERPAANLVFLIDVSGSMQRPDRLPLVVSSLELLTANLNARDQVAIVVYAGASGLVLPTTSCDRRGDIQDALRRLSAGGSTNGGAGIELAYAVAAQGFITGGTNRVVLCTDGDFNVGTTDKDSLVRLIEAKAKQRVFLTVLGFGMGNLKDATLEQLADKGNGNYGYVDALAEAKKLLVEELSGTLVAIAKDVKVQVEMNPARVKSYRLIGYENRKLAARDFNDDTKDAGEIGAGHTVTALYEVVPAIGTTPGVDPLRYQSAPARGKQPDELAFVKLRYKQPEGDTSALLEVPCRDAGQSFEAASIDLRFAAAVAAFGMSLRGSEHRGSATLDMASKLAKESLGEDAAGHRKELLELIEAAKGLGAR